MDFNHKFYIQSVHRALNLVQAIAEYSQGGCRLQELSERVQLPISTVYRIIQNLVDCQYVTEHEDGRYTLGMELARLGALAQENNDIVSLAHPLLQELSHQSGQTVYLARLDKASASVVYVDKVENEGNIKLAATVGDKNSIHATANGKTLVSEMSKDELCGLLELTNMTAITPNTITRVDQYLAEVEQVRRRGFALDLEENEKNVICVSAPIRNHLGEIVAAVSISGIAGITIRSDPSLNGPMVMNVARIISEKMGYKAE